MIHFVLGVTGKISSGKSTFSKQVSELKDWPVVSFGKYLIDYSERNRLIIDRPHLQALGEDMIKKDHIDFLNAVLDFSNITGDKIIVEGIRHIKIWEELVKRSDKNILVYIDAPVELRYARFCKRVKKGDALISSDEFGVLDNHEVEKDITELKSRSQYVLESESYEVNEVIKLFEF